MKNKLFYYFICSFIWIALQTSVQAQVKTKIYFDGIPSTKIKGSILLGRDVQIIAPAIFDKLLNKEAVEDDNTGEYKGKFAISVDVNIDFMKVATLVEENGFVVDIFLI